MVVTKQVPVLIPAEDLTDIADELTDLRLERRRILKVTCVLPVLSEETLKVVNAGGGLGAFKAQPLVLFVADVVGSCKSGDFFFTL